MSFAAPKPYRHNAARTGIGAKEAESNRRGRANREERVHWPVDHRLANTC